MPKKRMCREANIPDDICVCYSETEIPRAEAQQPADAFMKGINELLKATDNEAVYDQDGNSLPVKVACVIVLLHLFFVTFRKTTPVFP